VTPTASSTAQTAARALTDSQKAALLTLLTDEDPQVHQTVRAHIVACGPATRTWLQPHALSPDPVMRRRVADILHHLARQEADNDFLSFCLRHGEDCDLEEGAWLLARTRYPEINVAAYRALLDSYAEDIRERLGAELRSIGCLPVINDHLFNELGFRGNEKNYYDPDNSYLNRVLDRRTGNPISLCTLYWLVARRLGLPVVGVGLPRHFLCRYQTPTETVFLDAFNRGKLLTRADCIRFLQQIGQGFQENHLAPTTAGRTLLRMCSNLHQIYHELGHHDEAATLQRYVIALARH
jgi:regulator of sirC expression with transglutaminase-like and TPR domain